MRIAGMTYSEIKSNLGVCKSTLSVWLRNYPLPAERLKELKDGGMNARIEKTIKTKAKKRAERWESVYEQARNNIGSLTDRELFLCGLFLYWGEGSKTQYNTISISNTDPSVLVFFKQWMRLLGVPCEKLRVYLHLYADMDPHAEIRYWMQVLGLPQENFRTPYIKVSNRVGLTYTQKFIHGTCNLIYYDVLLGEYIHAALERVRDMTIADEP